ncbi:acyltransferase [Sinirhodobacter populi]|uniref:Acyltransferase n=1 Tax=Paenirhodobacter populi TaxID=2306993 RepID=A0A443KDN7_9RHOB|nr:acyltransferase [Sinirhodobacter populi]
MAVVSGKRPRLSIARHRVLGTRILGSCVQRAVRKAESPRPPPILGDRGTEQDQEGTEVTRPPGHYPMLDGMRGYAALIVMLYHLQHFFGDRLPVGNGFLAVDLFFMMSGFVIALSYETRLREGEIRFRGFLRRRFLRLYPAYLAATLFGLVVALILARQGVEVAAAFASALLMLPELILRGADGPFPLVPPAWSLFYEFWGNLFYAALAMRWRTRTLAVTVAGALAVYVAATQIGGTFELGVGYANLLPGIARFWFGFGLGVLIWRCRARLPDPGRAAVPLLLATLAFGAVPKVDALRFLWVAVVMPMGLIAALRMPLTGRAAAVTAHLGRMSYPLYLLHWPVMELVVHLAEGSEGARAWTDPVLGLTIVAVSCALTVILTYGVEPWLRRALDRITSCR